MLAQGKAKVAEINLSRDGLQEDGKYRRNSSQEWLIVVSVRKAPGLDNVWEADGVAFFLPRRDLLIAVALQNLQLLGLVFFFFRVMDRREKLFEMNKAYILRLATAILRYAMQR